jgi:hypothetical protein
VRFSLLPFACNRKRACATSLHRLILSSTVVRCPSSLPMKLRKSPNSLLGKIRTGQTRCDSLSISQHTPCRLRIFGWPRRAGCRDTSISARMALHTFASFSYFSFASRELNSPWTVGERDRGYSNPYLPLSLTIRLNAKLISKFTRAWLMMAVPPSPRDSVSGCQVTGNKSTSVV